MKTKTLILLLYCTCFTTLVTAQNPTFEWANKMGGTGSRDQGFAITTDNNGSIYTTGHFNDTADFDSGVGVVELISKGITDIYIQKLDTDGNLIWVKHMEGSHYTSRGSAITTDSKDNVYLTGYFSDTVDFDPGVGVVELISKGNSYDIFIQKLDPSGNLLWVKQMGNKLNHSFGYSLTTDARGNVYTTGYFKDTVDFDPGTGVTNLIAQYSDAFIQKLDSNGNFIWALKLGGNNSDYGNSIAVDLNGNLYATGAFSGTVDFDPDTGTYFLTSAGYTDTFILKLNSNGELIWVKKVGGTGSDYYWQFSKYSRF